MPAPSDYFSTALGLNQIQAGVPTPTLQLILAGLKGGQAGAKPQSPETPFQGPTLNREFLALLEQGLGAVPFSGRKSVGTPGS